MDLDEKIPKYKICLVVNCRKSFFNFQRSRKIGVDTVTKPMGAKRVEWSIWRYVSSVVHDDMIALR